MKNLYIIHGWTYTVEPWTRTLKLLSDAGLKVEMLHVPGLTEESKKVWTVEDYAKWADKNIPDGAIALGHSNGGRILLNLLSKKPTKLKHLILLDAAGVHEKSKKKSIVQTVSKIGKPLKNNKFIRKVYHKLVGAADYEKAPDNMKKTLTNMLESDKNLKIEDVTTPTTILWGEQDKVTPIHQAEIMQKRLPNSNLKTYKNWTHAPYLSHPDELARAIISTLEKI